MVKAPQPRAQLFCLSLVVLGLLGGQAVQLTVGPTTADATEPELEILDATGESNDWDAEEDADDDEVIIVLDEEEAPGEPTPVLEPPSKPVTKPDRRSSSPKQRPATKKLARVCRVTAYCDRGITASGRHVGPGQCAAPAYIPLGSKVYIPALKRSFVVTDRTARRFRNSTVDIFIPSRDHCVQFGRKYLQCEFAVPSKSARG